MECPICGRKVKTLVKAEIEGAIIEVCEECGKKYGRVISFPKIKRVKAKVKKAFEEETEIIPNYGSIIKERRIELGLTQEELAKKINEKKSLISKIEKEEILPDEKILKKLEKFLKVKLLTKVESHKIGAKTSATSLTIGDVVEVK